MNHFLNYLIIHGPDLRIKLVEHLLISFSAMFISIVIGITLGILISRCSKLKGLILSITHIFQTIPSIALLGFLIPFVGIGLIPTLIALVVYALLPITDNTYTGLKGVSANYLHVAHSLGFTRWQRLYLIELPLAQPVIIAGIRTAMAMTIGLTAIAAFIGAGGLGDFITQGLSLNDSKLILLGAIPSALLALSVDYVIATLSLVSSARQRSLMRFKLVRVGFMGIIISALFLLVIYDSFVHVTNSRYSIVVATKNFTEQYILGHMMAELIEKKTNLHVIKNFNLGTTAILQNALLEGAIDLYPEYTGTAYVIVLKQNKKMDAAPLYNFVKNAYQKKFSVTWLAPYGFENSESLAVKEQFALVHHLVTLSDLATLSKKITIGVLSEFFVRPDGLPGLQTTYELSFKKIIQMQPALLYEAIKNDEVEAIEAFTTDGRTREYNLRILKDDKHFYPAYYAAPIVRTSVLKNHPEIVQALRPLANSINNKLMQDLNYLVDVKKKDPQQVAHDFLMERGLI
jgi:osmoprotectant transport system permease protein